MAKWLAYLLPDLAALGLISSIPEILLEFRGKIINVAEFYQWHWLQ